MVTARPPLAAFNIELDIGDADVSRAVAASLREAGGGLPGVRAIGLPLSSGRAQVSANVHDPLAVPLGVVVERVRERAAPLGARPVEAEVIGLVPEGALAGYPDDVPIRAFDPARHVIERRLAASTD
jgi:glutamate formiminotransferase/glutamate formiminotransferase/formiminotetrahydrofolate cyclodeaminase